MDSIPMREGGTYVCSVLSMRIINKMADVTDQTISSHTFSHSFLEKRLEISEIRRKACANTRTNILEILS